MTCQELERLLYPYLDGEFQPEERIDLEAHVSTCATCQQRVDAETRMRQALRRAARHSVSQMRAPASLRSGIQSGLQREQRRAQVGLWLRAGAVALVVVTVGGGWAVYQTEQRQRASAQEAVRRHMVALKEQRPLEFVAGSAEQIEAWFNGKVDHRVTLPRLHNLKPEGARFSTLNGQEVVYIRYQLMPEHDTQPERRVGVFVYPAEDQRATAEEPPRVEKVGVDSSQNYNVVTWHENAITYELVADMDEKDIRQLLRDRQQRQQLVGTPRPLQVAPQRTSETPVQNVLLER